MAMRRPDTHLYHADGSLYMARFWLLRTRWFSMRLHHIATADLDRHFHDHPWSFISLVLRGGYREARPATIEPCFLDGSTEIERIIVTSRRAGSIALRRATDRHRVSGVMPETWTLVILGPKRQWWGFYTPNGKVHWRDYESHHHDVELPQERKMVIHWERGMFWHMGCEKERTGIMKAVSREETRSVIECLACGKKGYYPVGGAGSVCSPEIEPNGWENGKSSVQR